MPGFSWTPNGSPPSLENRMLVQVARFCRIAISLGTPRGVPSGYRLLRLLNPRRHMLELPREEYKPLYAQILPDLDPHATWDALR